MAAPFTFGRFCSHVLKICGNRTIVSGLQQSSRPVQFSSWQATADPALKQIPICPRQLAGRLPIRSSCCHHIRNSSSLSSPSQSVPKVSDADWNILANTSQSTALTEKVNTALQDENLGRLFAVVHIAGKQRKITTEDIIIIQHYFPPNIGDRIRLEKVLMVGSKDFSLVGQPMLSRDLVRIEATVVEKTLSHYKTKFKYVRRKGFRRFNLVRSKYTMLVINSIEVNGLPQK